MNQMPAILVFLSAAFTHNILLYYFLGICPALACSRRLQTAGGLGAAVTFVSTCTAMLNYVMYHHVLVPLGLEHLTFIVFIAVIASFVQFVEMFLERFSLRLYSALGIFLPLITVNCAILGVSLLMIISDYSFAQTACFGAGAGVGWTLAIVLLAGLRAKMEYSNVPGAFRGTAIAMVVAGVMAMTFMGFAGMSLGW